MLNIIIHKWGYFYLITHINTQQILIKCDKLDELSGYMERSISMYYNAIKTWIKLKF